MDVVAVLVFVLIGRAVHTGGVTASGLFSTAWPFASGLAVGWLTAIALRRSPTSMVAGVAVWIATVAIGMVLRIVSGQGTAFEFVLVALSFLGATMLGWRILLVAFRRMRVATHDHR